MTDIKPSISELQALSAAEPGPCSVCDGEGVIWLDGRASTCQRCAGTGNSMTVPTARLMSAIPALLEIAAAALAFTSSDDWVRACDDLNALLAALDKVRQ